MDENKPELDEVFKVYTDTWDKLVKVETLKEYRLNDNKILSLNPDFEALEFIVPDTEEVDNYTESYHIENTDQEIQEVYKQIKDGIEKIDSNIIFNPQKYYISLNLNKNFAFLEFRKSRINIVVMIPEEESKKYIKYHKITKLSQGVQNFYNGSCFRVIIENQENIDEVIHSLKVAYDRQL